MDKLFFAADLRPGHWDVPVSGPLQHTWGLWKFSWMGEQYSNSQVSFSITCILLLRERSGRQSWPLSSGMLEVGHSNSPETTLLFWETSSCQTVFRGLHQPGPTPLHPQLEPGWPGNGVGPVILEPRKAIWQALESGHWAPVLNSNSGAVNRLLWAPIPDEGWEDNTDVGITGFRTWPGRPSGGWAFFPSIKPLETDYHQNKMKTQRKFFW